MRSKALKLIRTYFQRHPPPGGARSFGSQSVDAFTACSQLGRGLNLGNALEAPKEGQWGVTLEASYFATIAKAGFSTVRVPICWSAHAGPQPPYTIDRAFFKRIDWVIAQAKRRQLRVILDFQHYREMNQEPARHEERFFAIWRQIAERYRREPPTVIFELLNEPIGNLDAPAWNRILAQALQVIRPTNPTRHVLIGPVNWNNCDALPSLILPDEDRNLIVTVHFYLPKEFTHQGAEWDAGSEQWLGTLWQGTEEEKKIIADALAAASDWGKRNNRPIYLGEFGAYDKADWESRLRWTECVARTAESLNMAWAYWEFCSGFGIYDPNKGQWRTQLLDILMSPLS